MLMIMDRVNGKNLNDYMIELDMRIEYNRHKFIVILLQIIYILISANVKGYYHNDCHVGNIMISENNFHTQLSFSDLLNINLNLNLIMINLNLNLIDINIPIIKLIDYGNCFFKKIEDNEFSYIADIVYFIENILKYIYTTYFDKKTSSQIPNINSINQQYFKHILLIIKKHIIDMVDNDNYTEDNIFHLHLISKDKLLEKSFKVSNIKIKIFFKNLIYELLTDIPEVIPYIQYNDTSINISKYATPELDTSINIKKYAELEPELETSINIRKYAKPELYTSISKYAEPELDTSKKENVSSIINSSSKLPTPATLKKYLKYKNKYLKLKNSI